MLCLWLLVVWFVCDGYLCLCIGWLVGSLVCGCCGASANCVVLLLTVCWVWLLVIVGGVWGCVLVGGLVAVGDACGYCYGRLRQVVRVVLLVCYCCVTVRLLSG